MSDQSQRSLAVDTRHSVLVQAPAGSGKTSLLVERYIALLATVEAPEKILAITFTKKAASEMRRRVLAYLDPSFDAWANHEQGIQEAVAVLQSKLEAWGLLENPQRMQIRTIDSFCHGLARTMPIVGQLGPVPQPTEQPKRLYRAAARQALQGQEDDDADASARQQLLAWCDHNHYRVETLIAQLLARREQWLKLITNENYFNRQRQDAFLTQVVDSVLSQAHQAWTMALKELAIDQPTLMDCLSKAASQLAEEGSESSITELQGLNEWPQATHACISGWAALREALITQDGQWRKAPNKNQGFPPKSLQKIAIEPILEALRGHGDLALLLKEAADLPDPHYSDEEWAILEALIRVLRDATGHLNLLFAETGMSDFTALSAAALQGLGDEENGYSDLALYLDNTIDHILVDEYQDTNWTQFQLLERLIQGWEPTAHRTLFMVGDPMQSIYRFREAEVGLFVRTRRAGIQGHALQYAQLTRNFRSSQTIVHWVNASLGPLFPTHEDIASGAIAYAPSDPTIDQLGQVLVQGFDHPEQEALAITDHISALLDQHAHQADFKIAIIVRARSHLRFIVPALQQRAIPFRAVKLDKLTDRPVVQDLLALTQALINPEHRAAVLALLRSPMIGLTLADLLAISESETVETMCQQVQALSLEAQQRAHRVFELLDKAQDHIGRRSIAALVEGAWYRLGGPHCSTLNIHEQQASEVNAYLDALAAAELNGLMDDWNDFLEWLDDAHTDGGPTGESVHVEILTMHGAKGLEWDAVVLPSLQAKPNQSDSELMYWLPFPLEDDEQGVLMAPLSASDDTANSPRVTLIKREQRRRQNYESLRLMYVATTRAKQSLLLTAVLKENKDGVISTPSGSLLETIWPTLGKTFEANRSSSPSPIDSELVHEFEEDTGDSTDTASLPDQTLYRVSADWQPSWPNAIAWTPRIETKDQFNEVEFNWAGTKARRIGTVMHHLLEWIGRRGIENINPSNRLVLYKKIPDLLKLLGTSAQQIEQLSKLLTQTLDQVLESETARWILSNAHAQSECEYALSGIIDGRWVNAVIDRTFVDEAGVRWIIDYKSGHHAGGDLAGFLDQEAERYTEQLGLYHRLFHQLGETQIKTALYLPRHDVLKVVHG